MAQLRDEALDRIVQIQCAVFHQQQHRARGHQLRAGEHPKQVVFTQGDALLAIGHTGAVQIDHLSADQNRR